MGPRMVEPEFSFRGRMNPFVFGKGVMGIAGENCKISVPEVFSALLPTRLPSPLWLLAPREFAASKQNFRTNASVQGLDTRL
jgi:hypothetical protein